jgi:transcriptional regulator with XRE-family HTH domain
MLSIYGKLIYMNTKSVPEEQLKQLYGISNYLKELRINENMTQLEVSHETGLHRNTMLRVESSKNFTLLTFLLLADFYNISPSQLFSILD